MVPSDPGDVDLYSQFTALKTSTLKTWIAVGGYDFSDLGPTRTAWSDMASTAAGRAAFIASLKSFMSKYGFQGVDIGTFHFRPRHPFEGCADECP